MRYAMVSKDYGQGRGYTFLPVSVNTGVNTVEIDRPYAAVEVLTRFFGEDFMLVVGNFVRMKPEKIKATGALQNACDIRLVGCKYLRTVSRLQQPIHSTVVDFIVEGKMAGTVDDNCTEYASGLFRVRYILDMRPCEKKCIGPIIDTCEGGNDPIFSQYDIQTNEYLIPIIRTEDYESIAQQIIDTYYQKQEQAQVGFVFRGDDLARRMGLKIRDVCFEDSSIMGQLYYEFADVELIDKFGKKYTFHVKPGTILINVGACNTLASRNSTILHECAHMYLDRWFFFLQMMTGNPAAAYTNRRRNYSKMQHRNTPVDWMELQCEKMPAYLSMPKKLISSYVEYGINQIGGERTPESIRTIVRRMSSDFAVSRAMAKYRLIELGYYEADGIMCYVDGQQIPDHGCSTQWPAGITYTISPTDVVMLIEKSERFDEVIRTGRYRYVEAHFCMNHPRYLEFDSKGIPHLTQYARTHINECCLSFSVSGRYKDTDYHSGSASRNKIRPVTDKYLTRYDFSAEPGEQNYDLENAAFVEDSFLWGELGYEMPEDFGMAVLDIMRKKGRTQESLALDLGVDRRALYKYLHQSSPSLEHMVGICVALSLPYNIAFDLIDAAGGRFRRTELHHLYRRFLIMSEQLTVTRCNDILAMKKYAPLFQGIEM